MNKLELEYNSTHQLLLERIRTANSFWLGSCVLYFSFISGAELFSVEESLKLLLLAYLVPCFLYSMNWSMYEMVKLQVYLDVILHKQVFGQRKPRPHSGSKLHKIENKQRYMVPVVFSIPSIPIYAFAIYQLAFQTGWTCKLTVEQILILASVFITLHATYRLYYSFSKPYWLLLAKEYKAMYGEASTTTNE